jgi:hypothetical protein
MSTPTVPAPSFTPTPAKAGAPPVLSNDWFAQTFLAVDKNAPKPIATNVQGGSVIQGGSVGMPGGTTSAQAKATIATQAAPKSGLPWGLGEGVISRASVYVKRAGFVIAGELIVLLGLGILALTYKDQIGTATAKFAGTAAKAAVVA